MRTDVLPAKNAGYYVDKTTGKNLVAFRPEFIYHYIMIIITQQHKKFI